MATVAVKGLSRFDAMSDCNGQTDEQTHFSTANTARVKPTLYRLRFQTASPIVWASCLKSTEAQSIWNVRRSRVCFQVTEKSFIW